MATLLGLSFYFHDSAAALVRDGRVVAAAAEERFCRRKHTNEFPKQAIEYCLEAGGLDSINEVKHLHLMLMGFDCIFEDNLCNLTLIRVCRWVLVCRIVGIDTADSIL